MKAPPPPPLSKCKNLELSITTRRKKRNLVVYGIDKLPDEILIVILSCLSLKEAVRTSVISRRWRYFWQFTSGSLDLDLNQWNGNRGTCIGAAEFSSWVDQVVKLHQGPSVDKFIVRCHGYLSSIHFCDWIRFAMQKEVRVFELDILRNDFPDLDKFLSISREVMPTMDRVGLSSLTSLTMVNVNVKDEIIEYLLSNCPQLEHLSISFDKHMKKLNVVGPSLKSLVIFTCTNLETCTISAANLVSFEYGQSPERPIVNLQFQNVPLLSELKLNGPHCGSFLFEPSGHSNYSHQLKTLILDLHIRDISRASKTLDDSLYGLPQLLCLKQLELNLYTAAGDSFLFFVMLIMACPFLSRFVVQFNYYWLGYKESIAAGFRGYKNMKADFSAHHHQCLKVVKLINLACYRSEFRFALALLQIAKSLEKIIIKHLPGYLGTERISPVRERAKELKANLPHGAELLIL